MNPNPFTPPLVRRFVRIAVVVGFILVTSAGATTSRNLTPPSAPSSPSVTSRQVTSLTLAWGPSFPASSVKGYNLFLNGKKVARTAALSWQYSALTCGTSYVLAVSAYSSSGTVSQLARVAASTAACPAAPDVTPPTAPSSFKLASVQPTALGLTWVGSTDNVAVAGYHVLVNGVVVAQVLSGTSYTLTGLSCQTTYALSVNAFDAAGNVSTPASLQGTTAVCPAPVAVTTGPTAPTGLALSSLLPTGLTLSWSASTDNVAVLGYHVSVNGALVAHVLSGTSYSFTGLSCQTSYVFSVDAFDAAGNVSTQASLTGTTAACPDTTPPSSPGGLALSSPLSTGITLSSAPSTDNVGVAGYDVYLGGSLVTRTSGLSYAYSGLGCGTGYTFSVDAFDAVGNVSTPSALTGTTTPCPSSTTTPVSSSGWTPVATANVALSPSGNDSTCGRSATSAAVSSLTPCKTWQQAYQIAAPGDTVAVLGGAYPAEEPDQGAINLTAVDKGSATHVTFACGDGNPVTFGPWPNQQFVITGSAHVTIQGRCFNFNRLWIGSGSAGVGADDVTVDDVSMWMFDISGAQNATVENSTVGPDVACALPGDGEPAAVDCQNNASDNEQFWYQAQQAGCGCWNWSFNVPKVHDNQNGQPTSNVLIKNNLIWRFSSRDPSLWHAGCLWTGFSSGTGLTVEGNQFKDCMAYDFLTDFPTNNVSYIDNTFTQPRDALRALPATDAGWASVPLEPYIDGGMKCVPGEVITGWQLIGNTWANGYDLTENGACLGVSSFPGIVISGNTIPAGATQVPAQPSATTTTSSIGGQSTTTPATIPSPDTTPPGAVTTPDQANATPTSTSPAATSPVDTTSVQTSPTAATTDTTPSDTSPSATTPVHGTPAVPATAPPSPNDTTTTDTTTSDPTPPVQSSTQSSGADAAAVTAPAPDSNQAPSAPAPVESHPAGHG